MIFASISRQSLLRRVSALALLAGIGGTAAACSDDGVTDPPPIGGEPSGDPGGEMPGTQKKPLYALSISIFNDSGSTTYIKLLDSFEAQPNVALATAREFAGYAATAVSGGKLIVSDGETPKMTRFTIGEDKTWTEEASLSFGNYSQTPLTQSIVVSEAQAYAPFDALGYVAWNPSTFTLGAEVPPATIPVARDGLTVARGYAHVVSSNYAYQTFYYTNSGFTQLGKTSAIGVLDATTNQWVAAPDVACPHMHIATKDDEGNAYFSPGQGSVAPAVLDPAFPRNCMARIKAGQTSLDPTFSAVKFADLAEGREGCSFFYIGKGIGFFNAYHAERDNVGPETPSSAIEFSSNYHLWTLDLNTMKAAIMQGIDFAGGQYTSYRVDDRVYVAIPAPDYSSTAIYEITAAGAAVKRFETEGWTYNMFRVR